MKDLNKEYKIACKRTFNFDTETLDTIKNEKTICIMGDLENMIVDKDADNKPNFFRSLESGLSKEKEDLMLSFYERYTHRDRYTHFIVPTSQKQYYQDFVGDLYKTDYDFICRIRDEVVYTIGFLNSSDGIDEFEQDIEKALSMKACSDESVNFLVELEQKYAAVYKVYAVSGEEAKSLTKQGVNILNSDNYKVESIVPNNILFTYYDDKTDYFDPKKFAKNFEKSKNAFAHRFGGGKKLKYNMIIMNPPYGSIGGPVTTEAKKHANKTVCLMPLSCYKNKSNELWRYVESMELADPKMFDDATIPDNLCICTLQETVVDGFKTYGDMEMRSYDSKFKAFYEKNKMLPTKYIMHQRNYSQINDWDFDVDFIESMRLPNKNGGGSGYRAGKSFAYQVNVLKKYDPKSLISMACIIKFHSPKEKDNFCSWAYSNIDGLANKLIYGLNVTGAGESCSIAIPQIDWETISDTPLWKEGKYDEAVLDAMGLKWNGDVIVDGNN